MPISIIGTVNLQIDQTNRFLMRKPLLCEHNARSGMIPTPCGGVTDSDRRKRQEGVPHQSLASFSTIDAMINTE